MIEPLRFSFDVECPVDHAFDVWTTRTSSWWPRSHTVSQEKGLQVVFEGRSGGRIFERTRGGREIEWGEITAWDPPRRLRYLWRIATDLAGATEVEITFSPRGQGTHIDIEHRGWEKLGDRGASWRDTNQGGWDGTLPHYIAACAKHVLPG